MVRVNAHPENANYGCVDCGSVNHTTGDTTWCRVAQAHCTCLPDRTVGGCPVHDRSLRNIISAHPSNPQGQL